MPTPHDTDPTRVIAATSGWLDRVVIGLGLCPFAKAVQARQQVRYRVTEATDGSQLLTVLEEELRALMAADPQVVDTALLIHPSALVDFLDYNDFLNDADDKLVELELDGELQVASFHPDYCFVDAAPGDAANFTNRSPYPMLHLLREASVSRALKTFPDPASIYERNIATLRGLSAEELARLVKG